MTDCVRCERLAAENNEMRGMLQAFVETLGPAGTAMFDSAMRVGFYLTKQSRADDAV